MDYEQAIETYQQALIDLAAALDAHHEARLECEPNFLTRILRDGFLQPMTAEERQRILHDRRNGEELLLWQGVLRQQKPNWNGIGWIFPFYTIAEMERAYELITRAELEQQAWSRVRQWALTYRLKWRGAALDIPTNIVKVRMKGAACGAAMRTLETSPPNLRYLTKTLLERLPPANYARRRIRLKIVVGEKLAPEILTPAVTRSIS